MQVRGPAPPTSPRLAPGSDQGTALHPTAVPVQEPTAASAGANHHGGAAPRSRCKGNHSKCTRRCEGLGTVQQREGCREAQSSTRQAKLHSARRQMRRRPCHPSRWDLFPSSKPGCSALGPRMGWMQAETQRPDPGPQQEQLLLQEPDRLSLGRTDIYKALRASKTFLGSQQHQAGVLNLARSTELGACADFQQHKR